MIVVSVNGHVLVRIVLVSFPFGMCWDVFAEQDTTVDPKVTFRSLLLLQDKFLSASDDNSKASIGRSILDIGDELVRGAMKPSEADSIAQTVKAGTALPEELQRYRPFWLLRALAAVEADDKVAGEEAAMVLKKLGPPNPEHSSYVDVLAALNVKGWLTKRSNRTAAMTGSSVDDSSTELASTNSNQMQVEPPMAGEKFPETRSRRMTDSEASEMSYAKLRYAINEMYARYGADFANRPELRRQFEKFSWYRPQSGLSWNEIEAKFSEIERANQELLASHRDAKKP